MPDNNQTLTIRQRPSWLTYILLAALIILAILYFRSCQKTTNPTVVYLKADSAIQEENRRLKDTAEAFRVYREKAVAADQKLASSEETIIDLTRTLVGLERRVRLLSGKVQVRIDSADCDELAIVANQYVDSAVKYRAERDSQSVIYQAKIANEIAFREETQRYLDSCRGVVKVVQPALFELKPRGALYLGISGIGNLDRVSAGPSVMFVPRSGKWMFGGGYGVGNAKPVYSINYLRKISFRR